MRKNHKKALGLLGLSAVVGLTAVAANLPTPAAATASVSDTITIVVKDDLPSISILDIIDGQVFTDPNIKVRFSYTNLESLKPTLTYLGNKRSRLAPNTVELTNFDFEYNEKDGIVSLNFNLDTLGFGYGYYLLTATGTGADGSADPVAVEFLYSPVSIKDLGNQTDENGYFTDSNINTDEVGDPILEIEAGPNVEYVTVNVYDKDGNPVIGNLDLTDLPGELTVPFFDHELATGDYIISLTAFNGTGQIGSPIFILYHYLAPETPNAPDTGNLTQSLNISRADYLATALIVFGIALIGAIALLVKKNKQRR